MAEKRVIGAQSRKIGGGQAAAAPAPPEPEAAPRRGRGRLLIVLAAVLAVLAAGAFVFLRPTEPAVPAEPEVGDTVTIEPRNINLADGHYLRLGFAIELVAEVEEVATAHATDIAIALFTGRTIAEVNDPERREELKSELSERLVEAYDGEVLTVYFTDFVTQ
ncbi:flagellar FliL protein [Georgenia satyanarayanai]|uniref:Flagellar protein FliL n=1 Tax=Georgenia satyanarayanai TaxID=860221 RepID=A0A2Y9A472_9MICO|nr:flagellar basal body-associated FliL family protein [Georgenia satyanarayanai]PYG01062.1 flagellar FliL protein [Georgenia satyanarayanai]SSA39301.1 flagellar FliL protein [Georgenia satyanarayanai]